MVTHQPLIISADVIPNQLSIEASSERCHLQTFGRKAMNNGLQLLVITSRSQNPLLGELGRYFSVPGVSWSLIYIIYTIQIWTNHTGDMLVRVNVKHPKGIRWMLRLHSWCSCKMSSELKAEVILVVSTGNAQSWSTLNINNFLTRNNYMWLYTFNDLHYFHLFIRLSTINSPLLLLTLPHVLGDFKWFQLLNLTIYDKKNSSRLDKTKPFWNKKTTRQKSSEPPIATVEARAYAKLMTPTDSLQSWRLKNNDISSFQQHVNCFFCAETISPKSQCLFCPKPWCFAVHRIWQFLPTS